MGLGNDKLGLKNINGKYFDVYLKTNQTGAPDTVDHPWTMVSFVPRSSVFSGPINISHFFSYLLSDKIMASNNYISSIEPGNEINTGRGTIIFSNYSITVTDFSAQN